MSGVGFRVSALGRTGSRTGPFMSGVGFRVSALGRTGSRTGPLAAELGATTSADGARWAAVGVDDGVSRAVPLMGDTNPAGESVSTRVEPKRSFTLRTSPAPPPPLAAANPAPAARPSWPAATADPAPTNSAKAATPRVRDP